MVGATGTRGSMCVLKQVLLVDVIDECMYAIDCLFCVGALMLWLYRGCFLSRSEELSAFVKSRCTLGGCVLNTRMLQTAAVIVDSDTQIICCYNKFLFGVGSCLVVVHLRRPSRRLAVMYVDYVHSEFFVVCMLRAAL